MSRVSSTGKVSGKHFLEPSLSRTGTKRRWKKITDATKKKGQAHKKLTCCFCSRRVPPCIKHFPGVVLDVATWPSEDEFVEALKVTSASPETLISDDCSQTPLIGSSSPSVPSQVKPSKAALSFIQAVKLVTKKANESGDRVQQQGLNAKMDLMLKSQEDSSRSQEEMKQLQKEMKQLAINHHEEMKQLQKAFDTKQEEVKRLQVEMRQQALDHHQETKQLQIQTLGQLSVLQSRVQAVLTQTYELHEYPIPRLFTVLPQNLVGWDAMNPFSNKFRLYFLCECGEHTRSVDKNIDIHFAKHEGYEIVRPKEFFQKYGSHVLTVLKMLKFGVSVAGVAVPAISHLVRADVISQAAAYLEQLKDIESRMEPVMAWMDKTLENEGEAIDEFEMQMKSKEALEGADLRKLDTFLKVKDESKVLGNLYRTVTFEGHVKWVCIDHYRENYQAYTAEEFRLVLNSLGGTFEKTIGRVEVKLRSKVEADQFYSAMVKARSVFDLDIIFDWPCTSSDLEALEAALKKSTRVSILRLDLRQYQAKLLSTSQYEVIFRFSTLPNMKTTHVLIPKEFVKFLSFQPKESSHRCKSSFELVVENVGKEIGILAEKLRTNVTLTILDLGCSPIGNNGARVLSVALKANSTITTLKLNSNSIGSCGAKELSMALRTNSALTTLHLGGNALGDEGAEALHVALRKNSTLATLNLEHNFIREAGAQALSVALKSNSTLTALDLGSNSIGDIGAMSLSEALRANSTLAALDLGNNCIGDNGVRALSMALETNSTLTTLNLERNWIGDNGAQALYRAIKVNKSLITLNLQSNLIRFEGALMLALANTVNSILTSLNLENNWAEGDTIQALTKVFETNSTETILNLEGKAIGDSGAQALSEALKTKSTVTTLNLGGNSIGDDGAQALSEALRTNLTLTSLNLQSNSIGFNGISTLKSVCQIRSTSITLGLRNNLIEEDAAQALFKALNTISTLTSLDLGNTAINDSGTQALSEALKANSTLTTLKLQNNSIGSYGARTLSVAISTNSTLVVLNLGDNCIGDIGVRALSVALKINSTLTTLNLEGNWIEDGGAQALSEALNSNSKSALSFLNLEDNCIGDNGSEALFAVLKTHAILTTLGLKNNSIKEDEDQDLLTVNIERRIGKVSSFLLGDLAALCLSFDPFLWINCTFLLSIVFGT